MTDIKKLIYSLSQIERKVISKIDIGSAKGISSQLKLSEDEVLKGILLLEQKNLLEVERIEEEKIVLDKLGEKYIKTNLPEITFLKEILNAPKKQSELSLDKEEISSALGILKRNNLIEIKKEDELIFSCKNEAKDYLKNSKNPLIEFEKGVNKNSLSKLQQEIVDSFKFRPGFLKEVKLKEISFKPNSELLKISKELNSKYNSLELIEALDLDMIKTGSWKGKEFRHYDVSLSTGGISNLGRRHPMLEANKILSEIFVEMGFQEMEGPMVETAFWNMDTMWIPQDHPARDEQDTFYLEGSGEVPTDIMNKVKKMHEKGINRTHTKEGDWSQEITKKLLLRTHSTATTFRTLAKLGEELKKGKDIDGKYYYLANVFRNEAVDATHLAEFYQAEGFIIGDDLSLADLMGFIKEYYAKLGIDKIKFKPTYNPYTEPSMEAHYYDPKLKKWYALINSGIFREETLVPLGLGGKTIIAWGMGASRVAALLSGRDSMREITGVTCDFEWMKSRPMMKRQITKR